MNLLKLINLVFVVVFIVAQSFAMRPSAARKIKLATTTTTEILHTTKETLNYPNLLSLVNMLMPAVHYKSLNRGNGSADNETATTYHASRTSEAENKILFPPTTSNGPTALMSTAQTGKTEQISKFSANKTGSQRNTNAQGNEYTAKISTPTINAPTIATLSTLESKTTTKSLDDVYTAKMSTLRNNTTIPSLIKPALKLEPLEHGKETLSDEQNSTNAAERTSEAQNELSLAETTTKVLTTVRTTSQISTSALVKDEKITKATTTNALNDDNDRIADDDYDEYYGEEAPAISTAAEGEDEHANNQIDDYEEFPDNTEDEELEIKPTKPRPGAKRRKLNRRSTVSPKIIYNEETTDTTKMRTPILRLLGQLERGNADENKELTISIPKYVTDQDGNQVRNTWAATFGVIFRDTRFNMGNQNIFPRAKLNTNSVKNYDPSNETLASVCVGRTSPLGGIKVEQWLSRHVYKDVHKHRPIYGDLRRDMYERGKSEECHTLEYNDWYKYQECAIRRNQRMEYIIPQYPSHQVIERIYD